MSLSTNIRRSFQAHCCDRAIRALAPNTIKFCKLVKQDKNWSVSLRKIIFFRIMLYDTTGVLSRSSSKHSNPHRILLLILPGGGGRALETSHRRPSTRCAERLCWTTAACEPRVCGFKNSFYSVELRTAWPKDAPLKVFFISDYIRF